VNILRDRRREKLYRDWVKYANLPEEHAPHPERAKPPREWRLSLSVSRDTLFYIAVGAAIFFMVASIVLLIIVLRR
jgi:hypothetical protein